MGIRTRPKTPDSQRLFVLAVIFFYLLSKEMEIDQAFSMKRRLSNQVSLGQLVDFGMQVMNEGGSVKISNYTGTHPGDFGLSRDRAWGNTLGSAYDPYSDAIPKFYTYVKHPAHPLWNEFPEPCTPQPRLQSTTPACVNPFSPVNILANESSISQRIKTRMQFQNAKMMQFFDKVGRPLGRYLRSQINLEY
jgi:hypothetical protein